MENLKVKIVGRRFNPIKQELKSGDTVVLIAEEDNKFDSDAIAAYTISNEKIGNVANSETTISSNNRKNGTISATELKSQINFGGNKVFEIVDRAFPSCIYLNVTGQEEAIETVEDSEIQALKMKVDSLNALVSNLQDEVNSLKVLLTVGEDNVSPTTFDGRVFYSVVGLSHFPGQDHLGYELSIEEEPIFEGAKGTALYLKSGDYRVGVFPSIKKKQYCMDHNIPYCDSKTLKGKTFDGNVIIEEIVYGEYAVVSI